MVSDDFVSCTQAGQKVCNGLAMIVITLHRTDAAENMHCYCPLNVQPDLFGQWCCIREWGRTGQARQTRIVPCPAPEAAQAARNRFRQAKERLGYM